VNDIAIQEGRWAPVSAGEYDRRTRTVSVNLTVVEEVAARFGHHAAVVIAAIVAHERVHVLSTPEALPHDEELRARAAATAASSADVVAHIDEVLAGAWT
jgi:predicted aconitase